MTDDKRDPADKEQPEETQPEETQPEETQPANPAASLEEPRKDVPQTSPQHRATWRNRLSTPLSRMVGIGLLAFIIGIFVGNLFDHHGGRGGHHGGKGGHHGEERGDRHGGERFR